MKKPSLKLLQKEKVVVIDSESGEVLHEKTNNIVSIANSRQEFYYMYSSLILFFKNSTDTKVKMFACILERYSTGVEFSMTKSLKNIIAEESGCSIRSLDNAFTQLIREDAVVEVGKRLYRVNPLYVFKGSTKNREECLKAVLTIKYQKTFND